MSGNIGNFHLEISKRPKLPLPSHGQPLLGGATLMPRGGMAHCGLLLDIRPMGCRTKSEAPETGRTGSKHLFLVTYFLALKHSGWGFFRDRIWVIGWQRSLNDAWASTDSSATSWMHLV